MSQPLTSLVDRLRRAEPEAVEAFLATWFRLIANAVGRVVADPERATRVTAAACRRLVRDVEAHPGHRAFCSRVLDSVRDTLFEELPSAAWTTTIFVKGRDILSEPVELAAIPDDMFGGSTPLLLQPLESLAGLGPERRLVLELLFNDRLPVEDLAYVLAVSRDVLQSFVFNVVDALSGATLLDHGPDCPPDIRTGLAVLDRRDDAGALDRIAAERAGCPGCTALVHRCRRTMELLTLDGRLDPPVPPDLAPELVRQIQARSAPRPNRPSRETPVHPGAGPAAASPGTWAGPPVPPMFPGPDRPAVAAGGWSSPRRPGRRIPLRGILVGGAMVGVIVFSLRSLDPGAFRIRDAPAGQTRDRQPSARVLGTFTNPFRTQQPIYAGTVIQSAPNHQTTVELRTGVQLVAQPEASLRVDPDRVEILDGSLVASTRTGALALGAGRLSGTHRGGDLQIQRRRDVTTEIRVGPGRLDLSIDDRPVAVDPYRKALFDERTGQLTVVDLDEGELAAIRSGLPAGSGAGPLGALSGLSAAAAAPKIMGAALLGLDRPRPEGAADATRAWAAGPGYRRAHRRAGDPPPVAGHTSPETDFRGP